MQIIRVRLTAAYISDAYFFNTPFKCKMSYSFILIGRRKILILCKGLGMTVKLRYNLNNLISIDKPQKTFSLSHDSKLKIVPEIMYFIIFAPILLLNIRNSKLKFFMENRKFMLYTTRHEIEMLYNELVQRYLCLKCETVYSKE